MLPIKFWFKKPLEIVYSSGCFDNNCKPKKLCKNCIQSIKLHKELSSRGFYRLPYNVKGCYWTNNTDLILEYREFGR